MDRHRIEQRVRIVLAGEIAGRWCDRTIRVERHEAAHAVVGHLYGRHCHICTAVPERGMAGHVSWTAEAEAAAGDVPSDRRQALILLAALNPGAGWRRIRSEYKRLHLETCDLLRNEIVSYRVNWLAFELRDRSTLSGAEVASAIAAADADMRTSWRRRYWDEALPQLQQLEATT